VNRKRNDQADLTEAFPVIGDRAKKKKEASILSREKCIFANHL
jgi:hypothetical protein